MFHRRPRRFNPAVRPASLRQGGPISGPSVSRGRISSPGISQTVGLHFCGSLVLCLRAVRRARRGRQIDAVLGRPPGCHPAGGAIEGFHQHSPRATTTPYDSG